MASVLSIQSHVVYGFAGNKCAIFPMQLLGVDAWALNTVQFSNHTSYGQWTGMVIPPAQIAEICQGIENIEALREADAVLSGYIGAPEQGAEILKTVERVKAANPKAIYFCDPVMGHPEKGCIVAAGVSDFFREHAVAAADILAPNLTELRILTDLPIANFDEALEAVQALQARGVKKVLVKHLGSAGREAGQFEMLLANDAGIWHIVRPLHDFNGKEPVGVGDLISAIFLAQLLLGKDDVSAFEHATNAVNDILAATARAGAYELQIIPARENIITPASQFRATQVR